MGVQRGKNSRKHGHAANGNSAEYQAWSAAKHRCFNPNSPNWDYYGGAGITMCKRWAESFESFLEDMGARPTGVHGKRAKYSIDRIDVSGNYEPGNCRWATYHTQNNNTSRTRWITIDGKTQPLSEWLRELNVPRRTFYGRLQMGMTEVEALREPSLQGRVKNGIIYVP